MDDPHVLVAPAHAFEQEGAAILVGVGAEGQRLHLRDERARGPGAGVGAAVSQSELAPAATGTPHSDKVRAPYIRM